MITSHHITSSWSWCCNSVYCIALHCIPLQQRPDLSQGPFPRYIGRKKRSEKYGKIIIMTTRTFLSTVYIDPRVSLDRDWGDYTHVQCHEHDSNPTTPVDLNIYSLGTYAMPWYVFAVLCFKYKQQCLLLLLGLWSTASAQQKVGFIRTRHFLFRIPFLSQQSFLHTIHFRLVRLHKQF